MGVFRSVSKPTYDAMMADQLAHGRRTSARPTSPALLTGNDTWTVSA